MSLMNTYVKILNNIVANWIYLIYDIFHTAACHLEEKYANYLPGQSQSYRCVLPLSVCMSPVCQICVGVFVFFHCCCQYPIFGMERNLIQISLFRFQVLAPSITTAALLIRICKLEITNRTRTRVRQMSQKQN